MAAGYDSRVDLHGVSPHECGRVVKQAWRQLQEKITDRDTSLLVIHGYGSSGAGGRIYDFFARVDRASKLSDRVRFVLGWQGNPGQTLIQGRGELPRFSI